MRPGHHWFYEFGTGSDSTSIKKEFKLQQNCRWGDYKGTHFKKGEYTLAIKQWLNRVEEDACGLTSC